MSPSVELSPSTFTRLQTHAVPLVDTIESVVSRLLDAYEAKSGAPIGGSEKTGVTEVRQFNPNTPPNLTHTKVLQIALSGQPFERGDAHWNGLLNAAVRKAKEKAKSTTDLKRLVIVNFVEGQKGDKGYRFLSDVGLSVQGQDANGAWKAACHIAQQLGCELRVTFIWRNEEGAAFPGVTGQLAVDGRV